MASSTLQIVAPHDTSQVLFDLSDETGTNSAEYGSVSVFLLGNPAFAAPAWQHDRFEPPGLTGGVTTFSRAGLAQMTLGIRIDASSYDNLNAAVGRLADLLVAGCVMKWSPNGSSYTRYIDVEPSASPVLLDGRELGLYEVLRLFDTPKGITLNLTVQPFMRGDALTGQTFSNATLTRQGSTANRPYNWAWSSATNIGSETLTDECYQFAIDTGNQRFLHQETAAASVAAAETWTVSGYIRVTDAAMTNVQVQARLLFEDSGGTTTNDEVGTLVTVTTAWQRVSVTAVAATSTDHVDAGLRLDNTSATSATVQMKNFQLEEAAAASPFHVKSETVNMTPTATGFARVLPIYNPSDAPAPCSFTIAAPDASSAVTDIFMAIRSSRRATGAHDLTEFLNGPFYAPADATANNWTVTLGTNVTDGGSFADINHATNPTVYSKKITWTRTANLDSLRGEFDVWARIEAQAAEKFYLQLRWGPNGGSPAPYTLPEVTHDVTGASAFGSVMVNLGRIRLPTDRNVQLGTLTLELWTHVGTADQDLEVHYLTFVPAETQAHIEVPAGGGETVIGAQLTSPPDEIGGDSFSAGGTVGTSMFLNADNEAAGMGPNTGTVYGAGQHVFTFRYQHISGGGAEDDWKVRIVNVTDGTEAAVKTYSNVGGGADYDDTLGLTLPSGANASTDAYQAQVVYTNRDEAVGSLEVSSISVESVPVLAQNEQVRSDPARVAVEKLASDDDLQGDVDCFGPTPFMVPPGYSIVWFEALDLPLANYTEPQSVDSRTITVAPVITPYHPV